MTAIRRLADFVATTPREAIPADHLASAKRNVLDTIGCMLLGSSAEVTQVAIQTGARWGSGDAPVFGTDASLPAPWAALANGASAHAFDLDDFTLIANDHPSAVMVPALFAEMATMGPDRRSGRDLLDAYLVGLEVIFRVGEAVNMGHYNRGWHTTSTIDALGATAALARFIGLDAEQTAMALSLTTSMNSGSVSQFGTMGKPLHAGFAAKAGVAAAALGAAGATGYDGALDGEVSFTSLTVPDGAVGFDAALEGLGETWGLDRFGIGVKFYPSCGYTHRTIDAVIELWESLGISSADEVETVSVNLPDFHLAILPFGVPNDPTEALFSTAYCAAVGLATGSCTSRDFVPEALERADIMALAGRVMVSDRVPARPWINVDLEDPDRVDVVLADGRAESITMPNWTGAPKKELSDAQLIAKFRDNCERYDPERATTIADRIEAAMSDLERSDSLTAFAAALVTD